MKRRRLAGFLWPQVQEPVFQHSCFEPLIDHPSNYTIRHSLVEEGAELIVGNGIEGRGDRLPITAIILTM